MKRRTVLTALAAVPATVVAAAAQEKIVRPDGPPHVDVLSGDAIGFQVEGAGRGGAVKGRFVVKVEGEWREIELVPRIRIAR